MWLGEESNVVQWLHSTFNLLWRCSGSSHCKSGGSMLEKVKILKAGWNRLGSTIQIRTPTVCDIAQERKTFWSWSWFPKLTKKLGWRSSACWINIADTITGDSSIMKWKIQWESYSPQNHELSVELCSPSDRRVHPFCFLELYFSEPELTVSQMARLWVDPHYPHIRSSGVGPSHQLQGGGGGGVVLQLGWVDVSHQTGPQILFLSGFKL